MTIQPSPSHHLILFSSIHPILHAIILNTPLHTPLMHFDLPHLLHSLNTFNPAHPLPNFIIPYPFHIALYHTRSRFYGPLPFAFYITPLLILELTSRRISIQPA